MKIHLILSTVMTTLTLALYGISQEVAPSSPILSGTEKLEWNDPLDVRMMRGAHQFVERKIAEAVEAKAGQWAHDFSSPDAYDISIRANREQLRFILGAGYRQNKVNTHVAFPLIPTPMRMERIGDDQIPAVVYEDDSFSVTRVRWPVFDQVFGEGILLEPKGNFTASIVLVPDADQHPEQLVGLIDGLSPANQIARRYAQSGVRVLIPMLINRHAMTTDGRIGQSSREWIYRQSFHMGRHILGYELDKIDAAIDWIKSTNIEGQPIGIAGWGEGALLAFYASALDTRIAVTLLSYDWEARNKLSGESWREPIYRNVWSLMNRFDDADLAMMIAPRKLILEQQAVPAINAKRDKAYDSSSGHENTKQNLAESTQRGIQQSSSRLLDLMSKANLDSKQWENWFETVPVDAKSPAAYSSATQTAFANALNVKLAVTKDAPILALDVELNEFVEERHQRQLIELDEYTQRLIRDSEFLREQFYLAKALPMLARRKWSTEAVHATSSVEGFTDHSPQYRQIFADEILGTFQEPLLPPNPRSRFIRQGSNWVAYDIVLDVAPELFAWGILMQPMDLKPGEKRPVVVLQHGRNGLPEKIMDGGYNGIAQKLLDRGYIVFAPHNLYRGEDEYRWLDRKANAIGKTLFSFLLLQHDQITQWLSSLPQVDGDRIAFYGNSYGGESAVRIPTVITKYALSICASDFNDWTRKVADTHDSHSFMTSIEWEMPYFNMGQTFSYAEMAYLMIPRPFMVERGHHDLVAPDHWVASEYAKVQLVYDQLGLSDRTAITFFQGGHTMRGEATVDFLEKHLGPARAP